MTGQNTATAQPGDSVLYRNRKHAVMSIKSTGIAAPYYRLWCDDPQCPEYERHGLTSYRLIQPLM